MSASLCLDMIRLFVCRVVSRVWVLTVHINAINMSSLQYFDHLAGGFFSSKHSNTFISFEYVTWSDVFIKNDHHN